MQLNLEAQAADTPERRKMWKPLPGMGIDEPFPEGTPDFDSIHQQKASFKWHNPFIGQFQDPAWPFFVKFNIIAETYQG